MKSDNEEKTKKYRLKIVQWQIEGLIRGQEVELNTISAF